MAFRDDFLWGASTAAYQIEGGAFEDGKGWSTWDSFTHWPGKIWMGHTGDVACDHYHRLEEDIDLMKQVGLKSYRFSFSWPRVLPEGTGKVNDKGLDFYKRLIDGLNEAGIKPFPTLFHWDFPYDLYCRGGWLNPDSSKWFAEYAELMGRTFGASVDRWFTLNEPQVTVSHGHQDGKHAPGLRLPERDLIRMTKNILLSHGRAVEALRASTPDGTLVGMAPVVMVGMPATEDEATIEAARRFTFEETPDLDFWANWVWTEPVFNGEVGPILQEKLAHHGTSISSDELATISTPVDFFGFNHYNARPIEVGPDGNPRVANYPMDTAITAFHWPVTPRGMFWGAKFLYERYRKPLYVTENGLSNIDWVGLDGQVHDPQRIDFTRRYLRELQAAADEGADIRGYFHWTLMDNFEWAEGYKERFGLIHVNYATGERTPKDSATWYRSVIEANGANL